MDLLPNPSTPPPASRPARRSPLRSSARRDSSARCNAEAECHAEDRCFEGAPRSRSAECPGRLRNCRGWISRPSSRPSPESGRDPARSREDRSTGASPPDRVPSRPAGRGRVAARSKMVRDHDVHAMPSWTTHSSSWSGGLVWVTMPSRLRQRLPGTSTWVAMLDQVERPSWCAAEMSANRAVGPHASAAATHRPPRVRREWPTA